MARIIELDWDCRSCGREKIPGRYKACPGCNNPREVAELGAIVIPRNTSALPSVTNPELLQLARAGRDWHCTYCDAGVRGDEPACSRCGAQRDLTTGGEAARLVPPLPSPPQDEDLGEVEADFASPSTQVSPWVFVAGTVGILILGLLVSWIFETHRVTGLVTSSTWAHEVVVERWTPVTVDEWERDAVEREERRPVNGVGGTPGLKLVRGSCRSEVHHTEEVQCGTTQECRDTYEDQVSVSSCGETCTSNGNGFATCVPKTCTSVNRVHTGVKCEDVAKFCDEPVYANKCDYVTQEWRRVEVRRTSGTHFEAPRWDIPTLSPLDRLRYSSGYAVNVQYVDGSPEQHRYKLGISLADTLPKAEAVTREYLRWSPNKVCYLLVNNLGLVQKVSLEPPKQ